MHPLRTVLVGGALFAVCSFAIKIREEEKEEEDPTSLFGPKCVVPANPVQTLEQSFSLSAFDDHDKIPWTVRFNNTWIGDVPTPIRTSNGYTPDINFASLDNPFPPPLFRLTDGELSLVKLPGAPSSGNLVAYFGPSLSPSLLDPLFFDDVKDGAKFYAGYYCQPFTKGTIFLELRTFKRNLSPCS